MALEKDAKPQGPTKVWVEHIEKILDPVTFRDSFSYKSLFEKDPKAQALWILRAGMREPIRVGWKQVLYPETKSSRTVKTRQRKPKKEKK